MMQTNVQIFIQESYEDGTGRFRCPKTGKLSPVMRDHKTIPVGWQSFNGWVLVGDAEIADLPRCIGTAFLQKDSSLPPWRYELLSSYGLDDVKGVREANGA